MSCPSRSIPPTLSNQATSTPTTSARIAAPPVLLGDVVLCPAIAAIAAPDHGGSLDDELALLVVHGVLHVLGHDHAEPDETAAMVERERDLLSELHWHGPVPSTFRHGSVPTVSTVPPQAPVAATFRQEQPKP